MRLKIFSFLLLVGVLGTVEGQQVLAKTDALKILMERNFDLKIADLNVEIADNNTGILNSGYLPTLSANGNINYNIDNSEIVFANGSDTTINGAESDGRGLNVNLNYVLFDGFNRKYNISRNRENLTVSQLNAQATLESVLISFYVTYYGVAEGQKALNSFKETLEVSKERYNRTQYEFEYGQSTRLDVSNAEIDVNSDSINYLNARQSQEALIRTLNLIVGMDPNEMYLVDTTVNFENMRNKEALFQSLLTNNTQIQLAESGVTISQYDNRISKRNLFPTISLNGGYSNAVNNFAPGNFLSSRSNNGITYGASFTWNLFDGGASTVASQNARINIGIQEIELDRTKQQIVADFENAWSVYQNQLFEVEAQQNNLGANRENFDRTLEKYKLGQVSSLDFRVAQNNLLQSELNLITARFAAKVAELEIYRLVGDIQEARF